MRWRQRDTRCAFTCRLARRGIPISCAVLPNARQISGFSGAACSGAKSGLLQTIVLVHTGHGIFVTEGVFMAPFNVRTFFLIIHVMAAGMVFAQIPIELILRRVRARQQGTPAELGTLLLQGQLNASLGAIGGMALLISGLALSFISPFGVLGIGGNTPAWLIIKQVNYIIIFIVLMA